MKSHEFLKGQLKHLLIHFGVEFENPYLDTYSPYDEAIEKVMAYFEEEQPCLLCSINKDHVEKSSLRSYSTFY
jgi:hypothetical protein